MSDSQEQATIAVLAVDALDYRLASHWNCQQLHLDQSQRLETEAYSTEYPSTKEVWPTIATGCSPSDHGLILNKSQTTTTAAWESRLLMTASNIAEHLLPTTVTTRLGRILHTRTSARQTLPMTDSEHVFDDAHNWVGITPAHSVAAAHDAWSAIQDGRLSHREVADRLYAAVAEALAWLQSRAGGCYGAHVHVLDTAGHAYCRHPKRLKSYYTALNHAVGWLRQTVDELVVISDHGMQTTILNDEEPGEHSWHATVAATNGLQGLPDSIYDVRNWLGNQSVTASRECVESDVDTEQLAALGYIDGNGGGHA